MLIFETIIDYYDKETSHKSKLRDKCSRQRLEQYFMGEDVLTMTRSHLRGYAKLRQLQGVSNSTINRELHYFRAAVNFYKLEQQLDFLNPVANLSLKEPDSIVRYITPVEATYLVEAATRFARTPQLPAFITLALNTGCRKTELFSLEWSRVDFYQRLIVLGSQHTKSAKRRFIPMNDKTVETLQGLQHWTKKNYPNSRFVMPSNSASGHITCMKHGFRNACNRAGIYNFRIHDLRHTFASWLVQGDVSLYHVKDLLGHASVTTTEKYAHLANEHLRSAVKILPDF